MHDLSALNLELGILKGGQAEVSLYARLTTAERQSHRRKPETRHTYVYIHIISRSLQVSCAIQTAKLHSIPNNAQQDQAVLLHGAHWISVRAESGLE